MTIGKLTSVTPNTSGGNMFGTSSNNTGTLSPSWSSNNGSQTFVAAPGSIPPAQTTGAVVAVPTASTTSSNQLTSQPVVSPTNNGSPALNATSASSTTTPVTAQLSSAIEVNPLNAFYQPAYHFRLFVCNDQDILTQSNNTISQITSRSVPQVTVAESGVTGFNIQDVKIDTLGPGNSTSRELNATTITMTVVEPMGISFPDALLGAAGSLGVSNVSKVAYYIELSFTGYNTDGTSAGRPLKAGFSNGGYWVWGIVIKTIDTKLNEGSATHTLNCVVISSAPLTDDKYNPMLTPKQMTVSGNTVADIYQDFATKLNKQWVDQYGGDASNPVILYANNSATGGASALPIVTHVVNFPGNLPANGKDPGKFKLKPASPDQNPSLTLAFDQADGKVTCTIPPGTSVSEFLLSAIKVTDEGQLLFKDSPNPDTIDLSSTQVNERGFRESVLFTVEPSVKFLSYDSDHGIYRRQITMHVVPHYTQEPLLSKTQVQQAQLSTIQAAMVQSLISKGFIRKQYNYIFTGLNTEVLDMDLSWNFVWAATLPDLDGARSSANTERTNAKQNPGNVSPSGTKVQVTPAEQQVGNTPATTTVSTQTTPQAGVTSTQATNTNPAAGSFTAPAVSAPNLTQPGPNATAVSAATQTTIQNSQNSNSPQMAAMGTQVAATNAAATPVNQPAAAATPAVAAPTTTPSQITTSNGSNTYVETSMSSVANGSLITSNTLPIPPSLWQGYLDTRRETPQGMFTGPYHRGMSVAGAVFAQVNGEGVVDGGWQLPGAGAKFQNIVLTVRGDPFWLGQTNLDREIVLRTGQPVYSPTALPDYISGNQLINIYFRYPLVVGDNFTPVLSPSQTFNGVYFVKAVTHTFSEGVFKQELNCGRLPLISMSAASTPASGTTSGGAASSPTLADTTSTTPATGVTATALAVDDGTS